MRFINVHTHVFTFNHVPLKFIPFMNVILWIHKYAPELLNKVLPEKIAAFLERGTRCDQLEILRELQIIIHLMLVLPFIRLTLSIWKLASAVKDMGLWSNWMK